MASAEGRAERKAISRLRSLLIELVISSAAIVIILRLLGFPPLLILEVFGLAALLAIFAILVIILGRRQTI